MSKDTAIEYCDSSLNLMAGCSGCELWSKTTRSCYAGVQTERYAGKKGWPLAFDAPTIFPERMAKAESWGDLRGTEREEKPWLNGMPRVIFLNDMGDTFTSGIALDWLSPFLPRIAATPHIYLLLTKRPSRLAAFCQVHRLPANVWIGTTVTSARTLPRVDQLLTVRTDGKRWLSVEPMWEPIPFAGRLHGIDWCVFGGESKQEHAHLPAPLDIGWIIDGLKQCEAADTVPFVKQLGSSPYWPGTVKLGDAEHKPQPLLLRDPHGGNWREWPLGLQVREMPKIAQVVSQPSLL